ncbi:MAG: 4-hydroxy-tetrahydrodipicolinate reductase [Gemmatales bacterium]|nr:4-hydroxy-tetrahydrodipicolinate reductase [Gemmatales bacterium]MDW8385637.1 4-hydroxy-tetrahydrodipicolinate reductase [Gemmatales bacterium]
MKTTVGINGACGRMGMRLIQLAHEDKELHIGAALESPHHPDLGKDIGELTGLRHLGVPLTAEVPGNVRLDVVIDFSTPEGTMHILRICQERRIPLVIATTGHTADQKREIEAAAHEIALLMAPNMSLAMNVLMKLVQEAAKVLKNRDFDVEIIERHHRFKKDAPSGTALHLARLVQGIMGQKHIRHGREGLIGERPGEEIGVHAVRVGDNVGEHTVVFTTLGETLELIHKAHSRDCYARGALQAAKFLADRPPGRYSMADVLGLNS